MSSKVTDAIRKREAKLASRKKDTKTKAKPEKEKGDAQGSA